MLPSPAGQVAPRELKHRCSKLLLVLKSKGQRDDALLLLRPTPVDFDQCEGLCAGLSHGSCPNKMACSHPHSQVEKDVWTREKERGFGLDKLVEDLNTSKLSIQVQVDALCHEYEGAFQIVCKKCYHSKEKSIVHKKRHSPHCSNGHVWKGNQLLVFVQDVDGNETHTSVEVFAGSNDSLAQKVNTLIKDANIGGYEPEDIVNVHLALCKKMQQLDHERARSTSNGTHWSGSDDSGMEEQDGSGFITHAKLDEFIEDNGIDELDVESDEDNEAEEGFDGRKPYYSVQDEASISRESGQYRECILHLDGPTNAVCKPLVRLQGEGDIVVRGRSNCGAAFDGDQVMVQLIRANCSEEKKETWGRVVSVTKKNTPRNGSLFLCTVNNYQSNLMQPLDGKVPKIHVLDECLKGRPVKERHNMVVVHNSKLKPIRTITLNPETKGKQIFVVKLLKWSLKFMYPLGYVCKVTSAGDSLEGSQLMLNAMYHVPTRENKACTHHAEQKLSADYIATKASQQRRVDLRQEVTFSIDPAGCRDIDDALSIKVIGAKRYKVDVHIADVAEFVEKGDILDRDASRRGTSYYSANSEPYHMLPKKLSQDMCSLLPGKDRLAVSVALTLKEDGELVEDAVEIRMTQIRSNKNFTYAEVQQIIERKNVSANSEIDKTIENKIKLLHNLAQTLRDRRMGDSRLFTEVHNGDVQEDVDARQLVEEFMICSNQQVARFLANKGIESIPLRCQDSPSEVDLAQWKQLAASWISKHAFYFDRFRSMLFGDDPLDEQLTVIPVLSTTLEGMLDAAEAGDMQTVRKLVTAEKLHPYHKLGMLAWFRIQEPSQYQCLACSRGLDKCTDHFSLQCSPYVHFTSPIRRYIDIVVHRQVKAVLRNEPVPHTCDQVGQICNNVNKKMKNASQYSAACTMLDVTQALFTKPKFLPGIISGIDDGMVELHFPCLEKLKKQARTVRYSSLSISIKPELYGNSAVKLSWKSRIYDTREHHPQARKQKSLGKAVSLDTCGLTYQIPLKMWQSTCNAVKERGDGALRSLCASGLQHLKDERNSLGLREVTSEMAYPEKLIQHNCEFDVTLKVGDVVAVQVGAQCQHGYLQPVITLLGLTRELDICLQHMNDSVHCFEQIASRCSKKERERYENIKQYQDIWKPIICMEAITSTICDGESFVVNHVPVVLQEKNGHYEGSIQLPQDFCKYRDLNLVRTVIKDESEEEAVDYLCLRCSLSFEAEQLPHKKAVWMAHAKVTKGSMISVEKAHYARLEFVIHHHDVAPPEQALHGNLSGVNWTVEFLSKPLPVR